MYVSPPGSNSIVILWEQPPGEVVDSYIVTYSFAIKDCPGEGGQEMISVNNSGIWLRVEENSNFNISLVARNAAGDSEAVQVIATTQPTIHPGAAPDDLQIVSSFASSIVVMQPLNRLYTLELPLMICK